MKTEENLKGQIIREYLTGAISFRALAKKYGFDFRTLHGWVRDYRLAHPKELVIIKENNSFKETEPMPNEIGQLQLALEQERLKNKLLNAIIDIAEADFSIPIRKKYGTKQFKK